MTPYAINLSPQQAYNRIRKHFSKPGARFGWDPARERCQYRTELPGKRVAKCAVGCLIPKSSYDPRMDDWDANSGATGIGDLMDAGQITLGGPSPAALHNFLYEAQCLHDQNASSIDEDDAARIARFLDELDACAANFGLDVSTPEPKGK